VARRGNSREEIAKAGKLDNVLRRKHCAYERLLRRGVYLVQMALGCRFAHELPDTVVEGAVDKEISTGVIRLMEALGIE